MWPDQEETRELLLHARQGNGDAVNRLLERHRQTLRRMVQCRLHSGLARRVDASDVVQDALLEASRRLADYLQNPQMPFHGWLRQLAHDRLVDTYRRQLAHKRDIGREEAISAGEASSPDLVLQIRDGGPTPAAQLLQRELATRFHAAVDRLPEEAREIVLMRHSEQLTNVQVAELLGLSEPAAAMRYLRALRQLRTLLGETPSLWLE